MEQLLYVVLIERSKNYNKMTKVMAEQHVAHIRSLDDEGKLVLCGAFRGWPGVAGTYIIKAGSYEEAEGICKAEPLVVAGFATYQLRTLKVANRDNNYLL